jgi:hypothetical protein
MQWAWVDTLVATQHYLPKEDVNILEELYKKFEVERQPHDGLLFVLSNDAELNDKYSKSNILITKHLFVNRHSLIRHSHLGNIEPILNSFSGALKMLIMEELNKTNQLIEEIHDK